MHVAAIAAMNDLRVIGNTKNASGLPWHCPEDLARFRELTDGHIVVMGRTTWEALPKKLPFRHNIVLSQRGFVNNFTKQPDEIFTTFEAVLKKYASDPRIIWVIGGAQVYAATLPYWKRLELTLIDGFQPGDVLMPPFEDYIEGMVAERRFKSGIFRTYLMKQKRR